LTSLSWIFGGAALGSTSFRAFVDGVFFLTGGLSIHHAVSGFRVGGWGGVSTD
jgi:hypothetical protein